MLAGAVQILWRNTPLRNDDFGRPGGSAHENRDRGYGVKTRVAQMGPGSIAALNKSLFSCHALLRLEPQRGSQFMRCDDFFLHQARELVRL